MSRCFSHSDSEDSPAATVSLLAQQNDIYSADDGQPIQDCWRFTQSVHLPLKARRRIHDRHICQKAHFTTQIRQFPISDLHQRIPSSLTRLRITSFGSKEPPLILDLPLTERYFISAIVLNRSKESLLDERGNIESDWSRGDVQGGVQREE